MLTREEVNERLETWTLDRSQRDALQTALAAMDERDALLAENRLLRDSLALVDDVRLALESAFLPRPAAEVARVRRLEAVLEAAEEYRSSQQVQMLNDVKYDEPKYERQQRAKKALDAAIAAYRERERPGGEDRETDGLA
jgi:hypothetical protein